MDGGLQSSWWNEREFLIPAMFSAFTSCVSTVPRTCLPMSGRECAAAVTWEGSSMFRPAPVTVRQHSLARQRGIERPVSLAEVLDRVLTKGVVVAGEVVISLAGIDLVYVAL